MITLTLKEEDWRKAKQCWKKISIKVDHDKSIDEDTKFLENLIFSNNHSSTTPNAANTTVNVPSVTTISQLMDEIEDDVKSKDIKNNLNDNVQAFIRKPVCFCHAIAISIVFSFVYRVNNY